MDRFEKERLENEERKRMVSSILRDAGVKICIGGCNCCDSPWVAIVHGDETIMIDGAPGIDNICIDTTDQGLSWDDRFRMEE